MKIINRLFKLINIIIIVMILFTTNVLGTNIPRPEPMSMDMNNMQGSIFVIVILVMKIFVIINFVLYFITLVRNKLSKTKKIGYLVIGILSIISIEIFKMTSSYNEAIYIDSKQYLKETVYPILLFNILMFIMQIVVFVQLIFSVRAKNIKK